MKVSGLYPIALECDLIYLSGLNYLETRPTLSDSSPRNKENTYRGTQLS